ncbi:MAG: hypothetical protein LBQ48_08140 [Oscillospiraceae bacterium]|jgi:transcriptional regulator GlxA family with amidase domain|nr:hypothetical protein [Oscillospiraceae bacterium]
MNIGQAAVMLSETGAPAADIAAQVGYESHTKFGTAFRTPPDFFHSNIEKSLSNRQPPTVNC